MRARSFRSRALLVFGACAAACHSPAVASRAPESGPVHRTDGPAARAGAPRWVVYESAECAARVEFPGVPVIATARIATLDGGRVVESATLEGTDHAMVAMCTELGDRAAADSGLMAAAEEGMLARTGARLLGERPSVGGRELRLAVRGQEIWARLMTIGESRLMTLVVAPIEASTEEDARRFLDSPRVAAPHR